MEACDVVRSVARSCCEGLRRVNSKMQVATRNLKSFQIKNLHSREGGIGVRRPGLVPYQPCCCSGIKASHAEVQPVVVCPRRRDFLVSVLLGHVLFSPKRSHAAIVDEEVAERVFAAAGMQQMRPYVVDPLLQAKGMSFSKE